MASRHSSRSYGEQMRRLVDDYIAEGNQWPAPARDIARWMIRNKKWDRGAETMVDLCAKEISRALRDEYHTDPQGRRVRTKHAAKMPAAKGSDEQLTLWHDIRFAPREFMERAFKQRRHQIVGDCAQLKTDVDSYNDNSSREQPIPMLFDFTDDLAELAMASSNESEDREAFDTGDFDVPSPFDIPPIAAAPAPSNTPNVPPVPPPQQSHRLH